MVSREALNDKKEDLAYPSANVLALAPLIPRGTMLSATRVAQVSANAILESEKISLPWD